MVGWVSFCTLKFFLLTIKKFADYEKLTFNMAEQVEITFISDIFTLKSVVE